MGMGEIVRGLSGKRAELVQGDPALGGTDLAKIPLEVGQPLFASALSVLVSTKRVFVCPRVFRVHNTRRSMNTDRDMERQSFETPAFQPVGLLPSRSQPAGYKNGLRWLSKCSVEISVSNSSIDSSGS